MLYRAFRSCLFRCDPESIHNTLKKVSHIIPKKILHRFCQVTHPCLCASMGNTQLNNPIGLAAGFDKNAELTDLLWALGFGFAEIGTVTAQACQGNPRPRIFRLVDDTSLINRMGLPNQGAQRCAQQLDKKEPPLPVGVNIAKTPSVAHTITEAIDDIVISLKLLHGKGVYTVINLSCPNTDDPKLFERPSNLEALLKEIRPPYQIRPIRPILLKLSPDLEIDKLRTTVDLATKYNIDGFVLGNTTTQRPNLRTPNTTVNAIGHGGLSGAALKTLADSQLKEVFDIVGRDKILIASGGIMNFQDLLDKLERGASLFQIYTGLIYNGPGFVKQLNNSLVRHCEKLGVKNYAKLVGLSRP